MERRIVVEFATTRGGPALSVLSSVLSQASFCAKSRDIPRSFHLLAKSARWKYAGYGVRHRPGHMMSLKEAGYSNGLSSAHVQSLMEIGAVYGHRLNSVGVAVTGRLRDLEEWVEEGTYVKVFLNPKRFPKVLGYDAAKAVVVDADDFLVINKPSGVPSIPSVDNYVDNVNHQTAVQLGYDQLWSVHRLDIPTSGLLILAKSKEACAHFHKLLLRHKIGKRYTFSVVRNSENASPLKAGTTITHWMNSNSVVPREISWEQSAAFDKEASLVIEHIDMHTDDRADVQVQLLTGRTHQIRAQFGLLGWPLLNDILYTRKGITNENTDVDFYDQDLNLTHCELDFQFGKTKYEIKLH